MSGAAEQAGRQPDTRLVGTGGTGRGGGRPTDRGPVGAARVLAVLTTLATLPAGASLEELATRLGQNKATVHHSLGTLCDSRLAIRDKHGHYVLGDEFLRLAFAHYEARPEDPRILPLLERLVARFGEAAHVAVLDGRDVVYRAKLDPSHGAVRLASTIGGRNPAHATGVGKALLADRLLSLDAVRAWVGRAPLERRTARTAVTAEELHRRLGATRARGFALDDRENEDVVNCIAFPLCLGPGPAASHAVSVSALAYRTSCDELVAAADDIRGIIRDVLDGEVSAA